MAAPLRVLVVEDSDDDFELLLRELERGRYDVQPGRVQSAEALREALQAGPWDVVISDYSLPGFSALEALAIVRDLAIDTPFLIVSGTISEDIAVEALKAGAHDFMVKDRLARLLPALERELREAENRRSRRQAEEERRKVEAQLLVADRMVSVGSLAAGVAHEINNPLAAVMANIEIALQDVAELATSQAQPAEVVTRLREELADASLAAERVRNIVRDLKIFSRGEDERRGPVDVERVMESTLRMAWNEIRHRARLVKSYTPVPPVAASESRLGQIFLNLVVNGAQAIPEGQADRNQIRIAIRREGDRVVVEVADSGAGIPPEVRNRIFAPFVTTKPVGVGTGLGLSICHRLVTELGGEISFETETGRGTTFRVSLPVARDDNHSAESEPSPPPAPVTEPGRILVIDDEPLVARTVQRALSAHFVIACSRASEALARLASGETFDVILCDLMMPEMTGMDFLAAVDAKTPEIAKRIVFLSGGAFTDRAREFAEKTHTPILEKPFAPDRLRSFVAERLAAQRKPS